MISISTSLMECTSNWPKWFYQVVLKICQNVDKSVVRQWMLVHASPITPVEHTNLFHGAVVELWLDVYFEGGVSVAAEAMYVGAGTGAGAAGRRERSGVTGQAGGTYSTTGQCTSYTPTLVQKNLQV